MKAKKLVKEYERQLKAEPNNLVLRLKFAAALREVGRTDEAVAMYRSVAVAYHEQGRLAQAIAVCRSVLEIEPAQRETQALLASLDAARAAQIAAAPPEAPPGGPGTPSAEWVGPPASSLRGESPRRAPSAGRSGTPGMGVPIGPPGTPGRGVPLSPPNAPTMIAHAAPRTPASAAPTVIMPQSMPPSPPPSSASGPMHRPTFFTPEALATTPARLPLPPESPPDALGGATVPGRKPRLATSPPTPAPQRPSTPPPLPPPPSERAPSEEEEEDDGLTIPSFGGGRPRIRSDVLPENDPHESATRIADSLSEAAAALAATDDVLAAADDMEVDGEGPAWDDPAGPSFATPEPAVSDRETTVPGGDAAPASGKRGTGFPPDLDPFARGGRLLDVPPWPDAAGPDEGAPTPTPPAPAPGVTVAGRKQRPEITQRGAAPPGMLEPATVVEASEDDLSLAQAFDRPFQAAVEALAPDGSTIEQPLAVFRDLPPDALRELHRRVIIRRVGAGTVIVREGDPGEACYIVQTGCVRVLKRDPQSPSGDHIEVARLGPGSLFGEFALLADRRRHATVQAIEATELYEIPRRLLRELSTRHGEVGPALERLYRERLVSTLLATAPFFRPLPEEQRGALMSRFDPLRVEDGHPVIREGEAGGGLYLVVLGAVEITKNQGDRTLVLATLGEGAYFGEMSLLRGARASATVTARGPVELAQLPPREFYAIVSEHPVLWEELRREAQRRELMTQNILAGDTNVV